MLSIQTFCCLIARPLSLYSYPCCHRSFYAIACFFTFVILYNIQSKYYSMRKALSYNGNVTLHKDSIATKKANDIVQSQQFQRFYNFLSPDQEARLRKCQNNDRMFSNMMRSFRNNNEGRSEDTPIYFPRNKKNLEMFLQFLKNRNCIEQELHDGNDQTIQDKVQGMLKLFELTKQYENQNTDIQIPAIKPKIRRAETTKTPTVCQRVNKQEKQQTIINYDDYGNYEMTMKKLSKMCSGLEEYRSEQQSLKKFKRRVPLKNNTFFMQNEPKPKYYVKKEIQQPKQVFKIVKKTNMDKYETKLRVDLTQPVLNFNMKKQKNFMKIKKDIVQLIQKAKTNFGLHFRNPLQMQLTDEQIKTQILNIKPIFKQQPSKCNKSKENVFVTNPPDQSVPRSLIKKIKVKPQGYYSNIKLQEMRLWTSQSHKRRALENTYKVIQF